MKKIYIVLTHTGTLLSRVIKIYTKNEFSHSSLALDKDLNYMYSFGRLYPNNPFIGGFVHEYINRGTFKRFFRTITKVYEIDVTDEQYEKAKCLIEKLEKDKSKYKFNIIGLFLVSIKVKFNTEKSFYCAEFVKYVLEESGIETNLPKLIKPEDFKQIENKRMVYEGLLRKYRYEDVKENTYVKVG